MLKHLIKTAPITLSLIVVIVAYFALQLLLGVSADNPSHQDLLRFGANLLPANIEQPWRLLSSGFVHIGLIHLLFNAFALYYFGQVAEMVLGKWRFLSVFLLSIIGGNVLGLYYNFYRYLNVEQTISLSAGASGGIMGLGAVLIAISLSPHIHANKLNQTSLLSIMAVNLIMGFALPNIDNAGHIGGALTGLVLGLVFGFLPKWSVFGVVLLSAGLGVAFWQLQIWASPYFL